MPAEGSPLESSFFPDGSPGLRRLSSAETERVWSLFRAAAKQCADNETGCCRVLAQEVIQLLSAPAQKESAK